MILLTTSTFFVNLNLKKSLNNTLEIKKSNYFIKRGKINNYMLITIILTYIINKSIID